MLLIASLVQVGVVVGDQVRVWHAAREAVRVAAVDPDADHVRAAAEAGGLQPLVVTISPESERRVQGEPVTVDIRFEGGRRLPLVGHLVGPAVLSAEATMRIESP
jgi:hypothetical protein